MMPQLHKALSPHGVPVYSCSGFDSLTARHQLANWISATWSYRGKVPIMMHLGDYDPDGESIYESLEDDVLGFLERDTPDLVSTFGQGLFHRVALTEWQVGAYDLPTALPKATSSRTAAWRGSATCQLEVLAPDDLRQILIDAVEGYLNMDQLRTTRSEK